MDCQGRGPEEGSRPVLKSRRLILWTGAWLLFFFVILVGLVVALAVLRPTHVVVYLVDRLAPNAAFSANEVRWTSWNSLRIENARFRRVLSVPRIILHWTWPGVLWKHRIQEVKLEGAEIFLDLHQLGELKPEPGQVIHPNDKTSFGGQASWGGAVLHPPWYLDKLIVERGGLVMVGLGAEMPPLALEVEGEYDDIPLGGTLSKADLQKPRKVEFRNIHIHAPNDLAVTMLKIECATLTFRRAGLLEHELDSLVFRRPVLRINRQFFWFVEELRSFHERNRNGTVPSGPAWRTKLFQIQEGELDITRLREIAIQFPFPFEVTRHDLALKDLSLADFPIEMSIPNQNITWGAAQMTFRNIRGKIAFHMGKTSGTPDKVGGTSAQDEPSSSEHANNVVNTVYVDSIHWKEMEVTQGWLAMTFTPKLIESRFGGNFAGGYLGGGVSSGWSGDDSWKAWGSGSDVNAGQISDELGYESFAMNGHARFGFEVSGKMADLQGSLKLQSLTPGTIQLRSLDRVVEKIRQNTEGLKKELLEAFTQGLRDYPYTKYTMDVQYSRPNALITFRSEGDRGSRKIDLVWHGDENEKQNSHSP